MYKKAFTLIEVLLAMTIVGIIIAVTANSLGNMSANKTKLAFENNYKHMMETIQSIVTDETVYPRIENLQDSYEATYGRNENRVSMCSYRADMFPTQFLEHTKVLGGTAVAGGVAFDAASGAYWVIQRSENACRTPATAGNPNQVNSADYYITFDVNGLGEGSNCPYTGTTLSTVAAGTCSNPDTFKFGLNYLNIVIMDDATRYGGNENLRTFLESKNYISTGY